MGGWAYYRDHHGNDVIPLLIQALSEYGTSKIAEGFVNSKDERLVNAGEKWAVDKGYFIKRSPNDRPFDLRLPGATSSQ